LTGLFPVNPDQRVVELRVHRSSSFSSGAANPVALPVSHHSIYRTADHKIGNHRQQYRDGQQFAWINPSLDNQLINDIHNNGQNENSSDCGPSLSEQVDALRRVSDEGPQIRRSALTSVSQAISESEQRGHERLKNDPERHWPTDSGGEVRQCTHDHVSHERSVPPRDSGWESRGIGIAVGLISCCSCY
jgi:hypothetical protein